VDEIFGPVGDQSELEGSTTENGSVAKMKGRMWVSPSFDQSSTFREMSFRVFGGECQRWSWPARPDPRPSSVDSGCICNKTNTCKRRKNRINWCQFHPRTELKRIDVRGRQKPEATRKQKQAVPNQTRKGHSHGSKEEGSGQEEGSRQEGSGQEEGSRQEEVILSDL